MHEALIAQNKNSVKKDCIVYGSCTSSSTKTGASTPKTHDLHVDIANKLNKEIALLKDANKQLEDKFQVSF